MDTLKLIPQLFYDLIARVMPGLTAIVAFSLATNIEIGTLLSILFEGSKAMQNSIFILSSTIIFCAYLLGHFIGILSDIFERKIVSKLLPSFFQNLKRAITGVDKRYNQEFRKFFINQIGFTQDDIETEKINEHIYTTAIFIWFDWLRVNDSESGTRSAKIRAEYRMHAGISLVMILAIIIHIILVGLSKTNFNIYFILIALLIGAISLWGLARTYRMFQWNVMNQYYVAKTK